MSHAEALHSEDRICLVTAKAETTYGTDPTPTPASNSVKVRRCKVTPQIQEVQKQRRRDRHAAPGVTIAQAWYEVELECALSGPGDPGAGALDEPEWAPIMKACGMSVDSTGSPVDTHAYTPDSDSSQASATIYVYWAPMGGGNWELQKITGAKGTWTIVGGDGDEIFVRFALTGLYTKPSSVSAPSGAVFAEEDDEAPPRGHTLTVDSRTDPVKSFEIAANAEVSPVLDQNGTYGVAYISRSLMQPTITHDAQLVRTATYDRAGKVLDETATTASLAINTVGGARYTIAAPNLQQGAWTYEADEGIERLSQTLYPRDTDGGSGDDSLSLTVTRP